MSHNFVGALVLYKEGQNPFQKPLKPFSETVFFLIYSIDNVKFALDTRKFKVCLENSAQNYVVCL